MADEPELPEMELPEMDLPEAELPEIEPLPLEGSEEGETPEPLAVEEAPIELTQNQAGGEPARKIQAFGSSAKPTFGGGAAAARQYKRALNLSGAGAVRCRIFHSKIGPGPIEYLE